MRAYNVELGLSQESPANRRELHWTYTGQVERGQRNISLHNIINIAEARRGSG